MDYQPPTTREENALEVAQIQAELERSPVLKAKLTYMSLVYAKQSSTFEFKSLLEDIAVATGVC